MIYGGHSYTFWWTFSIFIMCFFSVSVGHYVRRFNIGHGVQNVGHVRRLFIYTDNVSLGNLSQVFKIQKLDQYHLFEMLVMFCINVAIKLP